MPAATIASAPAVNGNATTSSHANGSASTPRVSKNAKRRAKKKQDRSAEQPSNAADGSSSSSVPVASTSSAPIKIDDREDEDDKKSLPPLTEFAAPPSDDEAFGQFKDIFAKFQAGDERDGGRGGADGAGPSKGDVIYSDDEAMSDSDATDSDGEGGRKAKEELSKRKQKKLSRLTVAELKQIVRKPEVVDWSDVTATDPKLLVQMKSTRNTVPVPTHWSQKREYLQNKRGIEKPPFELPSYIADTGIGTMKDALKEKEGDQSLKAKTRERVQPKMGKLDVDYQKLHDAFFRFQTKPPLSLYGETYYEGKEYEQKFMERKPGDLSSELKEALSIPPLAPPPWLIAMQRFGPPPSYPHLKIPGLNAPIPDGAQWGFHPGGWGRPPLDEFGQPLYGDVLGVAQEQSNGQEESIQRDMFGELDPEEEEEEESEEEEEEEAEDEVPEEEEEGLPRDGLETPGGMQSVTSTIPGGLETPDFLELRKQGRGGTSTPASQLAQMEDPRQTQQRSLYQTIPETQGSMRGFMGSERGYDLSSSASASAAPVLGAEDGRGTKRKTGRTNGNVEISFDPAELAEMSESELQERYDAARRAQTSGGVSGGAGVGGGGEDVSALREELSRKRRATEERRREKGAEKGDKEGRFRF
ncbi:DUF382-domain-containing protein [Microstroma glucosiphilum]|uniref:DUF382-domain-containing protein n=1 Tax=Pseudomicrostroma glucosiphilum TaxID=1684307 RepID=A0A316U8D8_9BASI|nr:DUF382-domain-containing protein [Pseudomicrostroma glucosiphilum]PWN20731.1 DUF382-domain-containing protein [Pseudomicrostroma glucosiphilum]